MAESESVKMLGEMEIQKIIHNNRVNGEVISISDECVVVEVSWGDWKHDHLRLKWVMEENFTVKKIESETTESDGSDCYSAIHKFYIGG